MKIYCSSCDKVQPVLIDDCRDAKTNEPFQDIVCADCHLVIASGTGISSEYERGFIDGMQKQMQSSVDRAVNRMAEQPAQQQEPVAIDRLYIEALIEGLYQNEDPVSIDAAEEFERLLKTPASPPASKPWVGLTRDERMSIINRLIGQDWVYALDAIEAKLKEKNA